MFLASLVLTAGLQETELRPSLEAARSAARWIAGQTVQTEHGVTWPVIPGERDPDTSLYSGAPGVVLFLLALEAAGGGEEWGKLGRQGSDDLIAGLPKEAAGIDAGLWSGIGGVGFALLEAGRLTGEERYTAGAVRVAELLHAAAEETEHGVRWSAVNDVIGGTAGTGFPSASNRERPSTAHRTPRLPRAPASI